MTPQQLMDMPGAGNAEKWLRKSGKWELTAAETITEKLDLMRDQLDDIETELNILEAK